MKKLLVLVLALALVIPSACAEQTEESPLASLSFDQLAVMRTIFQMEMMSRPEYKEVTVPQGVWQIGIDIPAGKWLVKCADLSRESSGLRYTVIRWGIGEPQNGVWSASNAKGSVYIYNPNSVYFTGGEITEYIISVSAGDYIQISSNKAVFCTYTGQLSMEFQ